MGPPCVQFNLIMLLLMTVCATQATFVQNLYKDMEPGQNITGTIVTELMTESKIQCSERCSHEPKCEAYQYIEFKPGNCLLIHRNPTAKYGMTFFSAKHSIVYEKECLVSYSWTPPSGWSGPNPVAYRSFENLECITLMEGTQQMNNAVCLNNNTRQWVDLGILEEACIARRETCSEPGAAVAFWMRTDSTAYSVAPGIISSYKNGAFSGFLIRIDSKHMSYTIFLLERFFKLENASKPVGWTHVVMNYIGPDNEQGILIYHDGELAGSANSKSDNNFSSGNGRVVLGRLYADSDSFYATVDVDEILFFNKAFSGEDIQAIKNMPQNS